MNFLLSAAQALLLVTALSTDAFVSGFAYGTNRIRIPLSSLAVIDLVCSAILAAALLFGKAVGNFLPPGLALAICVLILFGLGVSKIFDSAIKTLIRRHQNFRRKLKFSIFHLGFVLTVYADPEEADQDRSRVLSPSEAAYLAVALSLDGLAVGVGAGVSDINICLAVVFSLLTTLLAVPLGCALGHRLARKCPLDLSWLSGALLIVLALLKL